MKQRAVNCKISRKFSGWIIASRPIFLSIGIGCFFSLFFSCSGGKGIGSLQAKKSDETSSKKKRVDNTNQLVSQVRTIFSDHCLSCHKPGGSGGKLTDISDLESLIDQEFIVPGSKKSPLLKQMKSGKMPPKGSIAREQIDLVEKWIISGALIEIGIETGDRDFIRESELFRLAAEDLLGAVDQDTREHTRYFSATHLYNSGASQEVFDTVGQGLNKLMNSLSLKSKIKSVDVVSSSKGIFRIDIRDFGWTKETWEDLVRIYPYLIVPQDQKGLAVLQSDTKTTVPVVRADWFLATASMAPTYYGILGFPNTLLEFETRQGVNSAQAITSGNVMRAGFDNSAVSTANRVIERMESPDGAFWRSYEFGTSLNDQNIFEKPLGPVVADEAHAFRQDGGEFIVALKNGFLGFYIVGRDKKRLSKVPTNPEEDEIIAGQSCMLCHAKGYIFRRDMVVDKVKENAAISSILADVEKLYSNESDFKEKINADTDSYRKALAEAGVDISKSDPVNRISKGYSLTVSFAQVAAEAGVPEDVFREALENSDDLSALADGFEDGAVPRPLLNEVFPKLIEILQSKI